MTNGASGYGSSTATGCRGGRCLAARSTRDRHHEQARALFSGPKPRWFTSVLVCAEGYAWFLHRHGEEAARHFWLLLGSLDGMVVLDTDADLRDETWRVLDRLRGSRLTCIDAASLALLARHGIRTVQVLPRV